MSRLLRFRDSRGRGGRVRLGRLRRGHLLSRRGRPRLRGYRWSIGLRRIRIDGWWRRIRLRWRRIDWLRLNVCLRSGRGGWLRLRRRSSGLRIGVGLHLRLHDVVLRRWLMHLLRRRIHGLLRPWRVLRWRRILGLRRCILRLRHFIPRFRVVRGIFLGRRHRNRRRLRRSLLRQLLRGPAGHRAYGPLGAAVPGLVFQGKRGRFSQRPETQGAAGLDFFKVGKLLDKGIEESQRLCVPAIEVEVDCLAESPLGIVRG